ncbi:hypothetical protein HJFPF1_10715 [Paramyrothecium foliicola]|nr:hypothetical protein HJFPF1_10715 [Paramyrothecium foliicola]
MASPTIKSSFKKCQPFHIEHGDCNITHYVSEHSGLQTIVANRQGPMIYGYFTLASDVLDGNGVSKAMKHLVLRGSENFDYTGLLQRLSSRAYANVNAQDASDHITFALETAGWESFKKILPVYLENIFHPAITREAMSTEVWHIDAQGRDGGITYSEMRAEQLRGDNIMDSTARRHLGYSRVDVHHDINSITDSLCVLTPELMSQIHRDAYQLHNLCLIIVGEVDENEFLQALHKFEGSRESGFGKPQRQSTVTTVKFPEENESFGNILMGFRGPESKDYINILALDVLLTYLCGSSASILNKAPIEDEGCASSISYRVEPRFVSIIWIQLRTVAMEQLESVEKRFFVLLEEAASKDIDVAYMKECICLEKQQAKLKAEASHSYHAEKISTYFLYGNSDGSDLRAMDNLYTYDLLNKWTDREWRELLRKWMVTAHHVSVLGKPSRQMTIDLGSAEKARIAERIERYGLDGLARLDSKLKQAELKKAEPIPKHLIERWDIPGIESIRFIHTHTVYNSQDRGVAMSGGRAHKVVHAVSDALNGPLIQLEDISSDFVYITIHFNTSTVPTHLMPLIQIFTENLFNTHIRHDNEMTNFEQVARDLNKNTIEHSFGTAILLEDLDGIMIRLQVEPEKYEKAIRLLQDIMFRPIFDPLRISRAVSKTMENMTERRRNGMAMAKDISNVIHFKRSCLAIANNALLQVSQLEKLLEMLEFEPQMVLALFEKLSHAIFQPGNTRVLVAAKISTFPEPTLTRRLPEYEDFGTERMVDITKPLSLLNNEGKEPGQTGAVIVPMLSLFDTSYSVSSSKGLTDVKDKARSALMATVSYLESPESPLWKAVCGTGCASRVWFSSDFEPGVLSYHIDRSLDASKAIDASREIVRKIAEGEIQIETEMLEVALSQTILRIVRKQVNMPRAAEQKFVIQSIKDLPKDWLKQTLRQVKAVNTEDMKNVIKKFIVPLFTPGLSNVVVTCGETMCEDIQDAFIAMGYKTVRKQLSELYEDHTSGLRFVDS